MNTTYLDIWYLNSVWSLLSSISSGDKIGIKGNLVTIEKNHPFLWMKRKYYGDSRADVYQLIDNLLTMSAYHLKEKEDIKKNVTSFKYNIISGMKGLLNLRDTYIDDNRFLSIFNSSLEKMTILKDYYKEDEENKQLKELEDKIFIKNDKYSISQSIENSITNNNSENKNDIHTENYLYDKNINDKNIMDTNSKQYRLKKSKN